MTTIPARLARLSTTAKTPQEARALSRTLYRDFYRGVGIMDLQLQLALTSRVGN